MVWKYTCKFGTYNRIENKANQLVSYLSPSALSRSWEKGQKALYKHLNALVGTYTWWRTLSLPLYDSSWPITKHQCWNNRERVVSQMLWWTGKYFVFLFVLGRRTWVCAAGEGVINVTGRNFWGCLSWPPFKYAKCLALSDLRTFESQTQLVNKNSLSLYLFWVKEAFWDNGDPSFRVKLTAKQTLPQGWS